MTLNKHSKSLKLSFIFLLIIAGCQKKEYTNANPFDDYISEKGASVASSGSTIVIPAGALRSDQFIAISEPTMGTGTNSNGYVFTIDSTSYQKIVSDQIEFVRYNCTSLSKEGTITLNRESTSISFNSSKAKPYCIDMNDDINNPDNWELLPIFTKKQKSITFKFTNLEKIYFIGWNSI